MTMNEAHGPRRVADLKDQDRFLAELVRHKKKVAISLLNGSTLEGTIVGFDQFSILLDGAVTAFIYKHAIVSLRAPGEMRPAEPARRRIHLPGKGA
jgi:RNA chaperone Hfq